MNQSGTNPPTQSLLRLIGPMIIGYLLVLTAIDYFIYPRPTLSLIYYLLMLGDSLVLIGISRGPVVQRLLGKALVPTIICLLVIVPMIASFFSSVNQAPLAQRNPSTGPEMETLRSIPLSFTALVLVAWLYRMRYVLWFCLLVFLIQSILVSINSVPVLRDPLSAWLVVATIQFISFVIVGYFINFLVRQLNRQQIALAEANGQLIDYASTLEDLTISRERNAMARELHDTVAHTLSGLTMQLGTIRAYLDVDLGTAKAMLDRSLFATRRGLQDTRRALQSLRATPLDDLGLIKALQETAESTAKRGNLQVDVHLCQVDLRLPQAHEQVIYRITQEALNNILHHANARRVELSLFCQDGEIHLLIADDGSGFDPDQQYAMHFGLVGMRERAELVGGVLRIQSAPEKGTQVHLTLRNSR